MNLHLNQLIKYWWASEFVIFYNFFFVYFNLGNYQMFLFLSPILSMWEQKVSEHSSVQTKKESLADTRVIWNNLVLILGKSKHTKPEVKPHELTHTA